MSFLQVFDFLSNVAFWRTNIHLNFHSFLNLYGGFENIFFFRFSFKKKLFSKNSNERVESFSIFTNLFNVAL